MARPQNLLTNLKVANAKCPEGQTKIVLSDGGNLYLEKRRDGGASWIIRLTLKGQKLWRSLGTYPRYSLKEAREMASEYLKQLQSGKDPLVDKRKKKFADVENNISFDTAFNNWVKEYTSEWSVKHLARNQSIYKQYLKAPFGNLPLETITDTMCLQMLSKMNKKTSSTAVKAKSIMSSVFNTARDNLTFRGNNPLMSLRNNSLLRQKKTVHHKAIHDDDVGMFLDNLENYPNERLRVLMYGLWVTALRLGSLINAKWEWLDEKKCILTIPSEFMKGRKVFQCPIPPVAMSEILSLKQYSSVVKGSYIFFGKSYDKPMTSNAPLHLIKKLMGDEDITLHGFRTLFNRICTRNKWASIDVIEAQLSHENPNKIRQAYLGGEEYLYERKELVQQYENYGLSQKTKAQETAIKAVS